MASVINDELLSAIGKLTAEYGRVGNNLNQIARHLNEWRSPYPAMAKDKCGTHFIRESVLERMVLKHIQLAANSLNATSAASQS